MSIICDGEDTYPDYYTFLQGFSDRSDHQILYDRGIVYYKKGCYDQAIENFSAALEIEPYYLLALSSRGDAYAKKGEYDRAVADWTAVLEIEPNDLYALYSRAETYYKKGDYDRAIEDLETVLKISPNYDSNNQLLEKVRQAKAGVKE